MASALPRHTQQLRGEKDLHCPFANHLNPWAIPIFHMLSWQVAIQLHCLCKRCSLMGTFLAAGWLVCKPLAELFWICIKLTSLCNTQWWKEIIGQVTNSMSRGKTQHFFPDNVIKLTTLEQSGIPIFKRKRENSVSFAELYAHTASTSLDMNLPDHVKHSLLCVSFTAAFFYDILAW